MNSTRIKWCTSVYFCEYFAFITPATQYPNVNKLRPVPLYYSQLYKESMENPERFWGSLARQSLNWIRDFDHVMDCDMEEGRIAWFLGGKLNVTGIICIDNKFVSRKSWHSYYTVGENQYPLLTNIILLSLTCIKAWVSERAHNREYTDNSIIVSLKLSCDGNFES